MSLRTYEKKRDFKITSEPRAKKRSREEEPIFVVQLHHARARHYDFRLQVGNALKSWAVPKGPSFDPSVKRLAVEVEDHPIDYADFEGDIPEGQYGAGHVDVFDRGTWSTANNPRAQLAKGHLEFELHGERLHGAWHLVRSRREAKQPQWVLFKAKDDYASKVEADDLMDRTEQRSTQNYRKRPSKRQSEHSAKRQTKAANPGHTWSRRALLLDNAKRAAIKRGPFEPELARSADKAPQGDDWLHETKWDGYRILTTIVDGEIQLWSRNALEWTERLASIATALRALSLKSARFDGELMVDTASSNSFNELQTVLAGESKSPLVYALFDMPHIDGISLERCSLVDRKALLKQVIESAPSPALLFSDHHIGDGEVVFDAAVKRGLEGIMSKRVASGYRGGRGNDWVKVKSVSSDEFAIVGYTKGRGSRVGFGSLLLGRPDKKGGWEYAGRMGSGFSDVLLKKLGKVLPTLVRDSAPVSKTSLVERDTGKPHWVNPKLVIEVFYRGLGKEGLLRQASLKTLREDKSIDDLQSSPDTAVKAPSKPSSKSANTSRSKVQQSKQTSSDLDLSYVTHPERVVFPDDGYTKLQVAEYYERIMPWLLPQIANRPLSLVRCPSGSNAACFFQKHHTPQIGEHVQALPLRDSHGAKVQFIYVSDAEGIRELVQMNTLEFHPWGTAVSDVDTANLLIFDLDPGPGVSWRKVIEGAELVRHVLNDLKLESFVKLSGGKGLHVALPLKPAQPWEKAKQFCRNIAAALAQSKPRDFVDVATKSQRGGRIFVDYLRNSRGATSVAAYSLRARTGAPVAMPIEWEQLRDIPNAAIYTLETAPEYLTTRRHDPWQRIDSVRQTLPKMVASTTKPARKKSRSRRS